MSLCACHRYIFHRGVMFTPEPTMPEAAAISTMGYMTQPAPYTVDAGAYTVGTMQGARHFRL